MSGGTSCAGVEQLENLLLGRRPCRGRPAARIRCIARPPDPPQRNATQRIRNKSVPGRDLFHSAADSLPPLPPGAAPLYDRAAALLKGPRACKQDPLGGPPTARTCPTPGDGPEEHKGIDCIARTHTQLPATLQPQVAFRAGKDKVPPGEVRPITQRRPGSVFFRSAERSCPDGS